MIGFSEPAPIPEEDDEATQGYVGTVDYDAPDTDDDTDDD